MKLIEWLDNAVNKVTSGMTKRFMKLFGIENADNIVEDTIERAKDKGMNNQVQDMVEMATPNTELNEKAQEKVKEDINTLTPNINWQDLAMRVGGRFDKFRNKAIDGMMNAQNNLYGIDSSYYEDVKENAEEKGIGNTMQDMVTMATPETPLNDLANNRITENIDGIKNNISEQIKNSPIIKEVLPGVENLIQDKTEENIETPINNNNVDWQSIIDKEREKIWAREDEIRKETQQREDTAYQRAVEDMRKAGINPNLVGVNPAQSGGGITNAGRNEYTQYQTKLNESLKLLEQEIENEFKGDENKKDRINNLISSVIMAILFRK